MTRLTRRDLVVMASAMAAVPASVRAADSVELALVLLLDASASIGADWLAAQIDGHARAFAQPRLIAALAGRRVAVTAQAYAGPGQPLQELVPWRVLATPDDAVVFADTLSHAPRPSPQGATALGQAVVQAVRLLTRCPYGADRQVIDIVGNGFSNGGPSPRTARGHAAAANVTVNALVILDQYDWLESYYSEQVIAGPGAFVRAVSSPDDFAPALLDKLMIEIA